MIVQGETLYSGKFFPFYSEEVPCGIIIDPYSTGNTLAIRIEYSLCGTGSLLSDPRNDKRIISILQKDNKLVSIVQPRLTEATPCENSYQIWLIQCVFYLIALQGYISVRIYTEFHSLLINYNNQILVFI